MKGFAKWVAAVTLVVLLVAAGTVFFRRVPSGKFLFLVVEENSNSVLTDWPFSDPLDPWGWVDPEKSQIQVLGSKLKPGIEACVMRVLSSQGITYSSECKFYQTGRFSIRLERVPLSEQTFKDVAQLDARVVDGPVHIAKVSSNGQVFGSYAGFSFSLTPNESWLAVSVREAGLVHTCEGEDARLLMEKAQSQGLQFTVFKVTNYGLWPVSGIRTVGLQ